MAYLEDVDERAYFAWGIHTKGVEGEMQLSRELCKVWGGLDAPHRNSDFE